MFQELFYERELDYPYVDYESHNPIYDVYDDDLEFLLPCEDIIVEIVGVFDDELEIVAPTTMWSSSMKIPCTKLIMLSGLADNIDDAYILPMPMHDSRMN